MLEVEGIIYQISQFKDNDAVINILTSEGTKTFLARGVYRNTNLNHDILTPLLYGKFSLYTGPTNGYKLKDFLVIKNLFKNIILSGKKEIYFFALLEILKNTIVPDDEIVLFEKLRQYIMTFNEETFSCDLYLLLNEILKIIGLAPIEMKVEDETSLNNYLLRFNDYIHKYFNIKFSYTYLL